MSETPKTENLSQSFFQKYWYLIFLGCLITSTVLVKSFIADAYYIPSGSMEPTIHGTAKGGDRVLVNKLAYRKSNPANGDVIVFKAPPHWEEEIKSDALIKRVIATGGQTIRVDDDGDIEVDGKKVQETYLGNDFRFEKGFLDCKSNPVSQRCFPTQKIPEGMVWVMGDHRSISMDSAYGCRGTIDDRESDKCQGPIPLSNIIGRGESIVFPFSHRKPL